MICPQCGTDISEDSLFCNKCGYELIDSYTQDSIYEKNDKNPKATEKNKPHRYKGVFIACLVVLIFAVTSIVAYKVYQDKKEKEYYYSYESAFTETSLNILSETYACQTICEGVSKIWGTAIDSKIDFNAAISTFLGKLDNRGLIKERKDSKSKIENGMKQLKAPPKQYEEAYKLMIELYGYYTQLYQQATSPRGSLSTYNQDVNQKVSEFNKVYNKIKVIRPDIESKAKEKKQSVFKEQL